MNSFEELIQAVRARTPGEKQQIFSEIRDSILIHGLEKAFNIRAEVILEAIGRASDLTQRGVRGVIAETVFVLDVLPDLQNWQSEPVIGNVSYDACVAKGDRRVRIQVKMQRKKEGQPWMRGDSYLVEVQRTRKGEAKGASTRPYRFGEFDLLAVCMEPSTESWHSFMYVAAAKLVPDPKIATNIKTFQNVPDHKKGNSGDWTTSLTTALERLV